NPLCLERLGSQGGQPLSLRWSRRKVPPSGDQHTRGCEPSEKQPPGLHRVDPIFREHESTRSRRRPGVDEVGPDDIILVAAMLERMASLIVNEVHLRSLGCGIVLSELSGQ